MKKIIVFAAIILFFNSYSIGQSYRFVDDATQQNKADGFFASNYTEYREEVAEWGKMPMLPGQHGYTYDYAASAPLGSGLAIMAGLGLGYAMLRRKTTK
jgi:hypothetical protein